MGPTQNKHVSTMGQYLPFSPMHSQIYEEYQRSEGSLNLETKALHYITEAAKSDAQVIILTGDAGHGKTHLCRRLLEDHLGYGEDAARKLINEKCNGEHAIGSVDSKGNDRPLRIYKDFSELAPHLAADRVETELARTGELTVICANEGRLRAVLESNSSAPGCRKLLEQFHATFRTGLVSHDGLVHVVNLNYQSVAAQDGKTLIAQTLSEWLDGRRWRSCSGCESRTSCPVYRNYELLSLSHDAMAEKRTQRLELLFSSAERLGAVVTIREMLMIVAYAMTGGLSCLDVHDRLRRRKQGWQNAYAFYNLLFDLPPNLNSEQTKRIPALVKLKRLDPGRLSRRGVDEQLINELGIFSLGQLDLMFAARGTSTGPVDAAEGIDDIIGNPRNRKERREESEFSAMVVRSLRRRAYFDALSKSTTPIVALGFSNGDAFLDVLAGDLPRHKSSQLKAQIIEGLHTLQGIQTRRKQASLLLVDPAFGNATTHAAIISRKISPSNIKLLPMASQWQIDDASTSYTMLNAVDWIDRHVCLRVTLKDGCQKDFPLDLMMFDCISRASGGYIAESFYAHDIRKILNFLGRIAEGDDQGDGDISLFINGEIRSVSIDDDVIQVGGTS